MKFSFIATATICLLISAVIPENLLAQTPSSGQGTKRDIIVVAANAPGTATIFDQVRFNPAVVYSGPFNVKAIYYHNPGNPNWRVGVMKEIDLVSCRPALDSFRKTGTWKGHLKRDGSCGDTAEPVEWAVGNWLNFNSARNR